MDFSSEMSVLFCSFFVASFNGDGVLIPATTSSPWAFTSHSPKNLCSPVAGFLVKHTPVAELLPMLPNTIACTLVAVPQSCGMPSILRYEIARAPFQLLNTAPIPPHSCSHASSGNGLPSTLRISFLYSIQR